MDAGGNAEADADRDSDAVDYVVVAREIGSSAADAIWEQRLSVREDESRQCGTSSHMETAE